MMLSGWVKLHRQILESAVFTSLPPSDLKVFIACLSLANNEGRSWYNGQAEEEIPRGSFVTSQPKLAELTRLTRKQVRGALDRLQKIGSIWAKQRAKRYTVITVVNFESYQDQASGRGQEMGRPRANDGPTTGHNVRRKEGKKLHTPSDDGFDHFWTAYPRKVGKQAALAEWERLNPDLSLQAKILAAVQTQKGWPDWQRDGGRYIPHPRTWLHQGRWEDEPPTLPAEDDEE